VSPFPGCRLGSLWCWPPTARPAQRRRRSPPRRPFVLRGVVSTGWCGGLDPTLRVAQIVVADRVVSLATAGNGANQPLANARRSVLSTVDSEPGRPLGTSGSGGDDSCRGLLDPAEFPAASGRPAASAACPHRRRSSAPPREAPPRHRRHRRRWHATRRSRAAGIPLLCTRRQHLR
jgi:hypothetical protein